jgi:hypothetical protein
MASQPPITVECIREYDPPKIRVTITATGLSEDIPTDFYEALRLIVPGLPANPCS